MAAQDMESSRFCFSLLESPTAFLRSLHCLRNPSRPFKLWSSPQQSHHLWPPQQAHCVSTLSFFGFLVSLSLSLSHTHTHTHTQRSWLYLPTCTSLSSVEPSLNASVAATSAACANSTSASLSSLALIHLASWSTSVPLVLHPLELFSLQGLVGLSALLGGWLGFFAHCVCGGNKLLSQQVQQYKSLSAHKI